MNIEFYIGTEQLEFNEPINVVFSVGDIRDISLGNLNKSYTLNVPLTKTNRTILKHSETPGITDEITSTGRLYVNKMLIIAGTISMLSATEDYAKIIINADDWMETIKNTDLQDIDFTAKDHVYNKTNIVASWSAVDAFYRYPMINFGQLVTPATGAQPHDWAVNDFIPMFRIVDILEYIFSPWIIVSDWAATAYAGDMYMLGVEKRETDDFTENKALEVYVDDDTDNFQQEDFDADEQDTIVLNKTPVIFGAETTDEGDDFNHFTGIYTVPVTGTYRFTAELKSAWAAEGAGPVVDDSSFYVAIKKNAVIVLAEDTVVDETGGNAFTSIIVDTGYVHLEENDTVRVTTLLLATFTNGGTPFWIRTYITSGSDISYFENVWDTWNRHAGIGKTITAADYMPDIKCIDFVKAIKQLANLRFFVDRSNHKIYIEPAQSFYVTDEEIDLTPYQDYEEIATEIISTNYNKDIILGFKEDMNDKAYKEYTDGHEIPDRKKITLASQYTKPGEQSIINELFAHTVSLYFTEIVEYGESVPRIYGNEDYADGKDYPAYRAVGFIPRIFYWEGLTAGISFDIEETTYNTYPKVTPVDFEDLYTNYWLTTIHRLDKNIIVTVKIKMPQQVINQLMTVISDSSAEGFRPKYKLMIRGQYVYGYLNKLTTDGDISECEFTIKN